MENIDNLLLKVDKPSRYSGGELNSVFKEKFDLRFAFCFPDVYEVGMSHLGLQIIYSLVNSSSHYCERVFAPWIDMEKVLRDNLIDLFSLESKTPLHRFDVIGFTLQYEMSYTNVLNMLELGGVTLYSKERSEDDPYVIVGGPCTYNCEPLADFIDFAIIGEAEGLVVEVLDFIHSNKSKLTRGQILKALSGFQGVYVPSLYNVNYNEDGTIKSIDGNAVIRNINKTFDNVPAPTKPVVPFIDVVHERVAVELFRGCTRGCRFCQAGMIYRPIRERSPKTVKKLADDTLANTGYEEVSVTSLSSSDYKYIDELTSSMCDDYEKRNVNVSLPSLRVDNFSLELANKLQKVRKSSLTFAPEAGTQRLRDVINKNVTKDDLINTARSVFESGYNSIKLYFMIGLPTEKDEDIDGISDLSFSVMDEYYKLPREVRKSPPKITVSVSIFVPKANTPFQWFSQENIDEYYRKIDILKKSLRHKYIAFNYHDPKLSYLEGVFALGDRKLSKLLYLAFKKGCRFDGWAEHFDFQKWNEAIEESGITVDTYNRRVKNFDALLPWDHISCGVSKSYLIEEAKKALDEKTTYDCRLGCRICGLQDLCNG